MTIEVEDDLDVRGERENEHGHDNSRSGAKGKGKPLGRSESSAYQASLSTEQTVDFELFFSAVLFYPGRGRTDTSRAPSVDASTIIRTPNHETNTADDSGVESEADWHDDGPDQDEHAPQRASKVSEAMLIEVRLQCLTTSNSNFFFG